MTGNFDSQCDSFDAQLVAAMCLWSNAAHLMMAGSAKRIASAEDRYALENHCGLGKARPS